MSDEELRDAWLSCEALTAKAREKVLKRDKSADVQFLFDPVETLVKLLMLTGQRLRDISNMSWKEIDLDTAMLTIAPERFKSDMTHEVPLPALAVDIVKALPQLKGFVLTTTNGKRPIQGFRKLKERLDAEIAERRAKDGREPISSDWVYHDLRRNLRTRMTSDLTLRETPPNW